MVGEAAGPETCGRALGELEPGLRVSVVAKAFSALAHPMRLRIVELLSARGECSAAELVAALPVSQPRVSVHLRCLSECGFVTVRRDGRRAYYRLAGEHVTVLVATMQGHAQDCLEGLLGCLHCAPSDPDPDVPGSCC
jgi:DNA-binding transcriptional ArsR family regulator